MTLGTLIELIQSEYSKGVKSQSSRLTSRHIYELITSVRSKLLSQAADKNQAFSEWDYQTIPCVELQEASLSECGDCVPSNCKIYKSTQPFPDITSGSMRLAVKSVTSVDGMTVYGATEWKNLRSRKYSRYTSDMDDYFFHNGYLFLTGKKGGLSRRVTVTAVFSDPVAAMLYPRCGESGCIDIFNMDFPANGKFIDAIVQMVLERLKANFLQMKEDKVNNLTEG